MVHRITSGVPCSGARTQRRQRGFTILEMVTVLGIIGVLASLAMPAYVEYQKRARMVEVTAFLGEMRTALMAAHAETGTFPAQLHESRSRVAARQTSGTRVSRQNYRIPVTSSDLIDEYRYDYNPRRNIAYVMVRLNRDEVSDCRGRCMLHLAAAEIDGQVEMFCGRWSRAYWRDPFPPRSLRECSSTNVNRELRRASRGR